MLNVTILRKFFFPLHEKGERREGERQTKVHNEGRRCLTQRRLVR